MIDRLIDEANGEQNPAAVTGGTAWYGMGDLGVANGDLIVAVPGVRLLCLTPESPTAGSHYLLAGRVSIYNQTDDIQAFAQDQDG